jgi:hypothetical protein
LVNWGLSVAQHDIAAYLADLESKNGEPLSAAVAQGHTPGAGAKPRDDDTNPKLKAYTPVPPAPRQRTGTRPALDLGARPRTQNRMTALEPKPNAETLLRAPAGADQGEITERRPAEKKRSSPAVRALEPDILNDPTLPPGKVRAFAEPEPPKRREPRAEEAASKRRETPPVDVKAAAVSRPTAKKSSGLGRFLVFVLFMAGAVGGIGWKFGLRPADFKGVHDLGQLQAVLEAKLGDKPPPSQAAVPLKPPPPAPLLPAPILAAATVAAPTPEIDAGLPNAPQASAPAKPEEPKAHKPRVKLAEKSSKPEPQPPTPAPDAIPPAPATGTVLFSVIPWGNVSVNGKRLGPSPLPAEEMPAGTYTAEFSNPESDHVVHKKFTVLGGQQISVSVDMNKD